MPPDSGPYVFTHYRRTRVRKDLLCLLRLEDGNNTSSEFGMRSAELIRTSEFGVRNSFLKSSSEFESSVR